MKRPETKTQDRTAILADAFRHALQIASEQQGATAPNPVVGCVLLDARGGVLTAAAHLGAGLPHAEARAIAMAHAAGLAERIDTVIVTLEPCNHHGRTGPCSAAILSTPAREVWYGMADPNLVASGGAERLRAAGLRVFRLEDLDHPDRASLLVQAERLLAPFATRVQRARPFVTVKQALDPLGSMIPPKGAKTFTGPEALLLAHQLRRRADAIVTGSGTVLADQPEFTVRHLPDIAGKSRILTILDRRGRVDADYLAKAAGLGFRPEIATDLPEALRRLAAAGCNEVLVEAGPTLTSLVRDLGLWDEWVLIEKALEGQPDRITITRNSAAKDC
jgi:diaminohydroxyphosphoribosylaminopyrimidine deaminase / 5-amino-6-(5-phosphoribosylamino)uracil reductase